MKQSVETMTSPNTATAHLVRVAEGRVTAVIPLDGGTAAIGRQPDNTVAVVHRSSSRYHARLHLESDRWSIG